MQPILLGRPASAYGEQLVLGKGYLNKAWLGARGYGASKGYAVTHDITAYRPK
jgi:hypothetical protein